VSQVTVNLVGDNTSLELMVPKSEAAKAPTEADGWKSVAALEKQGATAQLKPAEAVQTRYVLVWLTKLPKEGSGFRGEISEVTVQK
jgi:putative peptidoglycan lipid II flippase